MLRTDAREFWQGASRGGRTRKAHMPGALRLTLFGDEGPDFNAGMPSPTVQGRMSRYRTTALAVVLSGLLFSFAPAVALGNSLLSGYGGPGEGSQAIIGSTLVKGGSGGGGGGSAGSGGSNGSSGGGASSGNSGSGASAGSGVQGVAGGTGQSGVTQSSGRAQSGARGAGSSGEGGGGRGGSAAGGGAGTAAGSGQQAGSSAGASGASAGSGSGLSGAGRVAPVSAVESQAVGLSQADLLYILLALAALVATGLLTRRLTHAPGTGRESLKGQGTTPD